jgi:hypothetical protein
MFMTAGRNSMGSGESDELAPVNRAKQACRSVAR